MTHRCCLWKCATNTETICKKEEKVNNLFAALGSLCIVKNFDSNGKMLPSHFKDFGHSFSLYGPPIRQTKHIYYISKLARVLRLVSLNLKLFLLPNCCVIYRQVFSTYLASKVLKLSFSLNCVLKRANDLKTISN